MTSVISSLDKLTEVLSQARQEGAEPMKSHEVVEVDCSGLNFGGLDLTYWRFRRCVLWRANFSGAVLRNARFIDCCNHSAIFQSADLRGAEFASCINTSMSECDLRGASFQTASCGIDNPLRDERAGSRDVPWWRHQYSLYSCKMAGVTSDHRAMFSLGSGVVAVRGLRYWVFISPGFMSIGCQDHTVAEWAAFDEEQIFEMDGVDAEDFWENYRDILLGICKQVMRGGRDTEDDLREMGLWHDFN